MEIAKPLKNKSHPFCAYFTKHRKRNEIQTLLTKLDPNKIFEIVGFLRVLYRVGWVVTNISMGNQAVRIKPENKCSLSFGLCRLICVRYF